MMNPGVKLPDMSLTDPTNRGDKNMQYPETVILNPQIMAIFSGVMPGSTIVWDRLSIEFEGDSYRFKERILRQAHANLPAFGP